jgi:hypothetical protein
MKTQQYTIFTKVVDGIIRAYVLNLHNKLSIVWLALREVNSFSSHFFKDILKKNSRKKNSIVQMFIYRLFILKSNNENY